jgi:branched-chain amino acid transport system substrate-binding protein
MQYVHQARRRGAIALLCAGAVVMTTAACGTSADANAEGDTFTLGVIIEETGELATLGKPELQAIELAAKQINANGGVDGRKVELVVRDSESQPAVAATAARDLATRGDIQAVLGTATGASCGAMNAILAPAKITHFCLSPIATEVNPVTFWAQGSLSDYDEFLVPWFKHEGFTRIGLVRTADATGDAMQAITEGIVKAAPESLKLAGIETFNSGATDVQTQLTGLRKLDPDVVVAGASGSNLIPIVQGMNALAMDMPVVVGHGSIAHSILGLVKDRLVAGGMYGGLYWVNVPADEIPDDVAYKDVILEFRKLWETEFGTPAGHSEAAAFDAANQVFAAVAAGAGTGEEIAEHIETSEYTGVLGPYSYSENDHQGVTYVHGMVKFGEDGLFHTSFVADE